MTEHRGEIAVYLALARLLLQERVEASASAEPATDEGLVPIQNVLNRNARVLHVALGTRGTEASGDVAMKGLP
jgi:hypothetical protein